MFASLSALAVLVEVKLIPSYGPCELLTKKKKRSGTGMFSEKPHDRHHGHVPSRPPRKVGEETYESRHLGDLGCDREFL